MSGVEPGIVARRIEIQPHRLDARDTQQLRQRLDGLRVAGADDDGRPAGCLECGDGRHGGGLDVLEVKLADRLGFGPAGTDDLQPAGEDLLERDLAVHGVVGHRGDLGQHGRAAQAGELVHALDGAERRVAVETEEFG